MKIDSKNNSRSKSRLDRSNYSVSRLEICRREKVVLAMYNSGSLFSMKSLKICICFSD